MDAAMLHVQHRVSGKDFLKTDSLCLTSVGNILTWYQTITNHGALFGIFIPPGHSLVPNEVMGNMWNVANAGAIKHAERPLMSGLIMKLLLDVKIYTKETIHLRAIAEAADGDGYAALHNFLRPHHPRLSETLVES